MAEEALSWLTATPLLRGLSDNQWQFASQALQGFLAATHLKDRGLAPATVQSLLFAGSRPGAVRPPPAQGPRRVARLAPA